MRTRAIIKIAKVEFDKKSFKTYQAWRIWRTAFVLAFGLGRKSFKDQISNDYEARKYM